MSAKLNVLLNLLNEFGKRDRMRGSPNILSLFRNEFNTLNKISNWSLFKLIIYDQALIILK